MKPPFTITETEDTPKVVFDSANETFEIIGRSFPEDASIFYKPIIDWFEDYIKKPNKATVIKFSFEYYNSASARQLLKLFKVLQKIHEQTSSLKIIWYYEPNDEQMKYNGEELQSLLDLPFDIREK